MSDFSSSLPIRTQTNGDVVAQLVDGTVTSQKLAIDATGKITSKLNDGAGNAITSQVNGAQRALDVGINVAGVQIDPRQIRALTSADVVTANQGTANTNANAWFVRLTDGTNNSTLLSTGEVKVSVTQLLTEDHNYGTVGTSTLRVASQLGNATGAANFAYGTVGAQTLRTASQIGNATGAADFGNGATSAQTVRTAANLAVAGTDVTSLNPVPVAVVSSVAGTQVNKYNTSAAVAAGSSVNHDYTITASKTFSVRKFWASASGKIKAEVQTSPDGTTFTSFWVGFNSTATPNITIDLDNLVISDSGTGSKMRIIVTNEDLQAFDVYSTISGTEL